MPRRKKTSEESIGVGMTSMRMKKKKPLSANYLVDIKPLTDNQQRLFDSYNDDKHLVAYGCAGTGKTFITLYNALKDVLDENTPYENVYIVRSLIATREIGFLPGDHEDKSSLYQIPYKSMVKYMFFDRESFFDKFEENSTFPQVLCDDKKLGGCVDTIKFLRENNVI